MGIEIAEEMRCGRRQQPRRCPVAQIVRIKQNQISSMRIIELVELETPIESGKIPLQKIDENLLSGCEHGAQRRVAGRSLRPRGLIGHRSSLVAGCPSQTINLAGRLCPFLGKPFAFWRSPQSGRHQS